MSVETADPRDVNPSGPPSGKAELRLTKQALPKRPAFTSSIILAADGMDAVAALTYVAANSNT